MPDPIVDIYDELNAQTIGGVLLGTNNLFKGFRRAADGTLVAAPSVHLREIGGGTKTPYMAGAPGDDYNRVFVQLVVPSVRQGYQAGRTLAFALIEFLHKRQVAGYTCWLAQAAAPSQVEDDEGRPVFQFTLRCEWKE